MAKISISRTTGGGTTNLSLIEDKITDQADDPSLPLVIFEPILLMPAQAPDLEALFVDVVEGGLIANNTITVEYSIANNSPRADAEESVTLIYLNSGPEIAGPVTLAEVVTEPIARAPTPGQQTVRTAKFDVQLPDEDDPIWSQGLPGFYTISLRVDATSQVKERDETNNSISHRFPIIPVPPNPLPGDYNYDGIVGTADYTIYRDSLGSIVDRRADGNEDGVIDDLDYAFWKARYGDTLSASGQSESDSTSAKSSIPENHSGSRSLEFSTGHLAKSTASRSDIDIAFALHADEVPSFSPVVSRSVPSLRAARTDSDDLLLLIATQLTEVEDVTDSVLTKETTSPSDRLELERPINQSATMIRSFHDWVLVDVESA